MARPSHGKWANAGAVFEPAAARPQHFLTRPRALEYHRSCRDGLHDRDTAARRQADGRTLGRRSAARRLGRCCPIATTEAAALHRLRCCLRDRLHRDGRADPRARAHGADPVPHARGAVPHHPCCRATTGVRASGLRARHGREGVSGVKGTHPHCHEGHGLRSQPRPPLLLARLPSRPRASRSAIQTGLHGYRISVADNQASSSAASRRATALVLTGAIGLAMALAFGAGWLLLHSWSVRLDRSAEYVCARPGTASTTTSVAEAPCLVESIQYKPASSYRCSPGAVHVYLDNDFDSEGSDQGKCWRTAHDRARAGAELALGALVVSAVARLLWARRTRRSSLACHA